MQLPPDQSVPDEPKPDVPPQATTPDARESIAPRLQRIILTLGIFTICAVLLMRWQHATQGQAPHLPGLLLFVLFALGTLFLGNDCVEFMHAYLKRRKSLLSPWSTVFSSLGIVLAVMITLALLLIVARII